jgi:hypothetical protein
MIEFFNTRQLDKLIEIADYIEGYHEKLFKLTDVVNNDTYRHLNDAGLFDYNYIDRGVPNTKNKLIKPSKTNLVFWTWLMIVVDLKSYGFVMKKLHKVKNYLFEDFDIIENMSSKPDRESLLKALENFEYKDKAIKEALEKKIKSGEFINKVKDQSVSRLFLMILKTISTGRDISLYLDGSGEAVFIDEFEIEASDLKKLSYDSRLILPLKKYLLYFIGQYAPEDYLVRSRILSDKEVFLLQEFKRQDIISFTVKFHNGTPNTYESKKLEKYQMAARLSDILIGKKYQDIILKTKEGQVYYSEITSKVKLEV